MREFDEKTMLEKIFANLDRRRSIKELRKYIGRKYNMKTYNRILITGALLGWAMLGVVVAFLALIFQAEIFYTRVGLWLAVLSVFPAIYAYRMSKDPWRIMGLPSDQDMVKVLIENTLSTGNRDCSLVPSKKECEIGFEVLRIRDVPESINIDDICHETAFISGRLDNMLTLSEHVPVVLRKKSADYISDHYYTKFKQFLYLTARAYGKEKTRNQQ